MYREQKAQQAKAFGLAQDYYRVRVQRVNEERPFDLEWSEGILYRAPKAYPSKLKVTYRLQVLTDDNRMHEVAMLTSKSEANKRIRKMRRDLRELTKMQFDAKYEIKDLILPQMKPLDDVMYFTGIVTRVNK